MEMSLLIAWKELVEIVRDRRVILQLVVKSLTVIPVLVYFNSTILVSGPRSIVVMLLMILCQFGLVLTTPIGINMVAGERETGTLETTFLICRSRTAIALGKVAAYTVANCCVVLLMFCSAAIAVYVGGLIINSASVPDTLVAIRLVAAYVLYGVGLIPTASIAVILIGALSKSSKEAIGYANAFHLLVGIAPAVVVGYKEHLGSATVAIPIVNLCEVIQLFVEYKLPFMQAVVVFGVVFVIDAIGLLFLVRRLFKYELVN